MAARYSYGNIVLGEIEREQHHLFSSLLLAAANLKVSTIVEVFEGAKFWGKFVVLLDNNVYKYPKIPDHFLKVCQGCGRGFLDLLSNKSTNR